MTAVDHDALLAEVDALLAAPLDEDLGDVGDELERLVAANRPREAETVRPGPREAGR